MLDGNKVTEKDCIDAVTDICFDVLGDGKTTVCTLTLYNGFTVRGSASCVDPAEFNEALGKQYSEEEARQAVWPVLGAILAEKLYRASQPPAERELTEVEQAAQAYLDAEAAYKAAYKGQTDAEAARNAAAKAFNTISKGSSVALGGYVLRQNPNLSWGVEVTKRIR